VLVDDPQSGITGLNGDGLPGVAEADLDALASDLDAAAASLDDQLGEREVLAAHRLLQGGLMAANGRASLLIAGLHPLLSER
jgi:hypothetical protein